MAKRLLARYRVHRLSIVGSTPGPRYCQHCGAPNDANATYCVGCGKMLNS